MIALPTLTVLIGAIGDVVSGFVNWYTEWIGKQTKSIVGILQALWPKKRETNERPGNMDKTKTNEDDDDLMFQDIANIERHRTVPLDFRTDALTELQVEIAEETYRLFIMLRAAQTTLTHLNNDPPRRYTYKEWSWLLKLLGEDESDVSAPKIRNLLWRLLTDDICSQHNIVESAKSYQRAQKSLLH